MEAEEGAIVFLFLCSGRWPSPPFSCVSVYFLNPVNRKFESNNVTTRSYNLADGE